MSKNFSKLRQVPPVVLLLLAALFAALIFSMYKVATSFTAKRESPEYDRVPSKAFVDIPPYTLLSKADKQALDENSTIRIPDDYYIELLSRSQNIIQSFLDNTMTSKQLENEGLPPALATEALNQGRDLLGVSVREEQIRFPSEDTEMITVTPPRSIALSAVIPYAKNDTAYDGTVSFSYTEQGQEWLLDDLQIFLGP